MDEDTLFDIFKIAIDNEREAYKFYKRAATSTSYPDAKKLFEDLVAVELKHESLLQEKYRDMKERLFSPAKLNTIVGRKMGERGTVVYNSFFTLSKYRNPHAPNFM